MKASEKNRIQNCMTVSNIGIANILSDPFGVTATQVISYLLSTNSPNEEVCKKLIKVKLKRRRIKLSTLFEVLKLNPIKL